MSGISDPLDIILAPVVSEKSYGLLETGRYTFIVHPDSNKKDPNAAISEPVKPIVYYVDPATPTKWVPYIKKGIEAWQPAFEAAGFRNAIIAKDAPSMQEDPDWSAPRLSRSRSDGPPRHGAAGAPPLSREHL